jgi:hypothetical protein
MIKIKFSQPYFQPNFHNKTTSVAKMVKNILTLLQIINEVMRLVCGELIGYGGCFVRKSG